MDPLRRWSGGMASANDFAGSFNSEDDSFFRTTRQFLSKNANFRLKLLLFDLETKTAIKRGSFSITLPENVSQIRFPKNYRYLHSIAQSIAKFWKRKDYVIVNW